MICLLVFSCLSGVCLGLDVRQSTSDLITKPGDKVQIFCSHDKSDYRVMLWYQRSPGDTAMKLIGFLYFNDVTMEEPYKEDFEISGDLRENTAKNSSLKVKLVKHEHSTVYYCAAREAGAVNSEAYFGRGTKLTVLEPDCEITKPTVQVLPPAAKECRDQKDNARKKTIVCVATGFYPDHVQVSWQINGNSVTNGVATDEAALREDKFYKITSRLRVLAKEWYKPDTKFTCTVSFFDGTETTSHSDSINGEEAKGEALTKEKYLRITQTAKFSYSVFIIKSITYGAFVGFLVWKLQSSAGKQNN